MATLYQDQVPPPKAVNIIRPSSPGFRHYLKQRSSSALNYYPYHSYQHSTLSTTSSDDLHSPPSLGSNSSTTSSCSSPSTLSTLSSYSGYNTNGNKLPPPTILNSSSIGFGFFQSQQNSTTSPTTWFKSPSPPSQQQQEKPIPITIDATVPLLSTPTVSSPTTPKPTPAAAAAAATVKALPSSGFMTPFSSRFFRVPQQPYAADIHLEEDSSGDEHSHFGPQDGDDDDHYDSIDGDTEPENSDDDDDDNSDYMDDLNDSMTDYDDESQENDDGDQLPIKIVAKIKHGTIIMNGKGEFVNKGGDDDRASYSSWLDEARASRKIADLEIEKSSLMTLNSALESKVAQQTARIATLEKQLHTNEWPLSPVSDKDMDEYTPCFDAAASTEILTEDEIANDQVFQRLRSMLLGLIEHAEEAVRQKTKSTGRVLTLYNGQDDKNVITLDPPPTPPVKSLKKKQTPRQRSLPATTTTSQQETRPLRRSSDAANDNRRRQPSTSSTGPTTRKRASMQRSLSRASSPAMLVTATTTKDVPSPIPPRPASAPMQRSSTTKPRPSHLRKSQDLESPKWHY